MCTPFPTQNLLKLLQLLKVVGVHLAKLLKDEKSATLLILAYGNISRRTCLSNL